MSEFNPLAVQLQASAVVGDARMVIAAGADLATQADVERYGAALVSLKGARKAVEAAFEAPVSAAHERHKALTTMRGAVYRAIDEVIGDGVRALADWHTRAAEAAEQAAAEETARMQRVLDERTLEMASSLTKMGQTELAERVLANPQQAQQRPAEAPALPAGVSFRTARYTFKVVDPEKVPAYWNCLDLDRIGDAVDAVRDDGGASRLAAQFGGGILVYRKDRGATIRA